MSIQVPAEWRARGYDVSLLCTQASETLYDQMRELFRLCATTGVQWVPGRRPIGHDPTPDEVNIQYISFTHGEKPENGWYLLMGWDTFEDQSPLGLGRNFMAELLFLGDMSVLQLGYKMCEMEEVTNDWEA